MIATIVIQIEKPSGLKVTYINRGETFYRKTLAQVQHKCKVKEVIYGGAYTYFDEGMDFTFSLDSGSVITVDNRKEFGFTVLGV